MNSQRGRAARGQSSIDMVLLFVCVIGGMVLLGRYLQRGAQGNFFSSIMSIGQQWDSEDAYTETQTVSATDTLTQQSGGAMIGTDLIAQAPGGGLDAEMTLGSLPTGGVYRQPPGYNFQSSSTWTASGSATYDANR